MPTNKQRLFGAIISAGITVGGAWLASTSYSDSKSAANTNFSEGISATFSGIRNATGSIVVIGLSFFKIKTVKNVRTVIESFDKLLP